MSGNYVKKETLQSQWKWIKILLLLALLCLVVLLATMSNCSDNSTTIKALARDVIEKECKDSLNCIVSIPMLTPYEWDRMYVFEYNMTDEEINQVIHQKFRRHLELTKVWLFMRGDSIVYFEEHEIDFERPTKRDLIFPKGSEKFAEFTPSSAVFNVSTKWWKEYGYSYYVLSSILYDKIEQIKSKDTTVIYAELLDKDQVLLYRSNYPDALFFVKLSDSSLYKVDSIVDFYYDFTVYQTEADLIKNRRDILKKMDDGDRLKKMIEYGTISHPIMNRFAGELFIVGDNGIYELSLSRRSFKKIVHYHMALDIFEDCNDNNIIGRLPNPQKSISSSAIRVSFQDSSFFELTSNGSLNIQVVDSNSCLKVRGQYNQVHYDYAEGKKCNARIPLCEPF
ncbi:hypothetical protein [Fibrobacter sp.]|uniref:hypothetical protein n=1 Tax=Fibrobacter sp. TaxID=35828 RepID=UPI0025B97CE4|nr:hypothetical protein [Fibrobacter sp.]